MSFNDWNPWCKGAGFALSVFAAQAVASMASVRSQCGLVANQVKESILRTIKIIFFPSVL